MPQCTTCHFACECREEKLRKMALILYWINFTQENPSLTEVRAEINDVFTREDIKELMTPYE